MSEPTVRHNVLVRTFRPEAAMRKAAADLEGTTAVIIDDHPLVVQAAAAILRPAGVQVVGMASTAKDGAALVARRQPDIVVLDLGLPDRDGVELINDLASAHPRTRIIVFTGTDSGRQLNDALEAGAMALVAKGSDHHELVAAVRAVTAGTHFMDPRLRSGVGGGVLSGREREVLRALAGGATMEAVGAELFVSAETIRTHVRNARIKLGAHNVTEAVALAIQRGEITPLREQRD